jgi:hypothetical protein
MRGIDIFVRLPNQLTAECTVSNSSAENALPLIEDPRLHNPTVVAFLIN